MSENQRTQIKATIRRAMQAAERATNELDAQAMRELATLYQSALVEIQYLITNAADELGMVRLSQLQALTTQIEGILNQINLTQSNMVDGYIVEAAKNGGNTFSTSIPVTKVSESIDSAVLAVRTMKQKDGLQLSDRLWRIHRNAKEKLVNTVERAVILGNSASDAAMEYQRRMEAIPSDISRQMNMANGASINKSVADALIKDQGAPYYQIKRVMTTEIYRSYDVAFQNSASEHDFVAGFQFTLAKNHPKRDICDMHATVNLYGLGKGVYPKGKSPLPAHPGTRSFHLMVFWDEITDEDRTNIDANRIDWLKSQNRETQKAVLGHDKKVSALHRDLLSQNMIATPWKHVEPALKRKGIDTDSL